jgi:hypothetical protein
MEIFLLTICVIMHTIFGIGSVATMLTFSFREHYIIFDFLALCSVISFLIFKRCLAIDIYEFIKGDLEDSEIPFYAKDNFFRKLIHNFNDTQTIDYTYKRLDILDNISEISDCHLFFNRKVQYILFNTVLILILGVKYRVEFLLPLFMAWVMITFPA